MTAPHGNFDDVLAEALAAVGIVDSRKQVRERIAKLRARSGDDYDDTRIKRAMQDIWIDQLKESNRRRLGK